MKNTTYTKSCLVRELAFNVGVTQKNVRFILDALREIVYREAANQGITIPGVCRLDVITRKPRKMRNPQTGEFILIAEHKALRVRALKCARSRVTPSPEGLITSMPQETPPEGKILDDFSQAVSFRCKKCGQEIEAPLAAAGMTAECPVCATPITIPTESEPGTLHNPAATAAPDPMPEGKAPDASLAEKTDVLSAAEAPAPSAPALPPTQPAAADSAHQKNQTIRIDLAALGLDNTTPGSTAKPVSQKRMLSFFCKNCRQEIESPADMAGTPAECPSCGCSFEVPFFSDPGTLHGSDLEKKSPEALREMKSRTIRIEVPDDI